RQVRLLESRSKQVVFANEIRRIDSKDLSATSTIFFFGNSIHFPADHITPEATESVFLDADDHDNTTRPSMLMAYGICTLEHQFNSYDSTAILQSGGYSTKTAILTSTTNSIATFRQLFYNLAATLRNLPSINSIATSRQLFSILAATPRKLPILLRQPTQ
ncbi:hypothetical protein E4U30_000758, partial [Claviceps sp. LM220 group G6]